MELIKCILRDPTTISLSERFDHRLGHHISIEYHFAFGITSSTTDDLDQRRRTTEKSFFISIQNSDQCHLRQINTFPQALNTYKDIYLTRPQLLDNLSTIHRRDL